MKKLAATRNMINDALTKEGAKSAVFFSGGIDSLLTLYLAREVKADIDVITYSSDWSKRQLKQLERLIFDWNLNLYTYPPQNRYFVPNGENLSVVDEYGFNGRVVPVLRDIETGTKCAFDLDQTRFTGLYGAWNTVLTGFLSSDTHPLSGKNILAQTPLHTENNIDFHSPLHHWTKDEIREVAWLFDLDRYIIEGTGEIPLCTNCLMTLDPCVFCPKKGEQVARLDWDSAGVLREFRRKYRF